MWIVNIALRRPYTFIVAALLIVLSLPYIFRNMSVDILPAIDIPVVAEIWEYRGLTTREMADRITSGAERDLSQAVDGIEHTESITMAGQSLVKVFFQPGTDIRTAMNQVTMSVASAVRGMPPGTQNGRVRQYSASELPLVQLGISSTTLSDTEIGDLASNVIRPILTTRKGVSVTYPYGSKNRQVSVDLDPHALLANNLTPADVVTAMGTQNLVLPTGVLKIADSEYDIQLNGAVPSLDEIANIPVRTDADGHTVRVRDVANVRDGFQPGTTLARQNGERGVLNSVLKAGGISTLDVVQHVRDSVPVMLEKLPDDVQIKLMFDQSLFVRAAVSNLAVEALIAAALTAAMILLFLGNWRSTCIIAVSIPLSIATSLIILYLVGETINLMTLGGLALAVGILVDDATVEIENIERQMAMGKTPVQAILDGAKEVAVPAFVSTLCICIVFVPMFFLTGVVRSLFVPLAEAVIFAMLASYLLSRTLVPTLVMYMFKGQHHHGHGDAAVGGKSALARLHGSFNRGFERFRAHYEVVLAGLLHKPSRFVAAFMVFCVASLAIFPNLGQDLFPSMDTHQLRLHVRAPSGTRLEQMPPLIDRIEAHIRSRIPAEQQGDILDIIGGPYSTLNTLYGNSGTTETADAEIMISLQKGTLKTAELARILRQELPPLFPDTEFFFQPPDQVSQTLNFGIPAPIDVQFIGGKTEEILPLAIEVNNALRRIPGIVDAHIYQRFNKPSLALEMNRVQLQQLGLSAQDVAQNTLISLSGSMQTVPSNWLNPANGNTYNIGARTLETDLDSIDALLQTPIGSGNTGTPQVLGSVVDVKRINLPTAITLYNRMPMINIHANVEGSDLGAISRAIDQVLADARPKLPRGAELTVRGQIQTLHDSFTGIGIGLAVAILLVYLLIVVNFQSWLDPLIIIGALPAALAGIAWTLFLCGTTLSIPAMMGTIMAMGVATANSILLISFARQRLSEGVPPL
ncbi:MAG TPA: efflux RND transporter permease subunit, partial [Dongiaceae bacterium]|nr:efflux RND transporter permease subunit [Dongiaceae bacterium]